MAEEYRLPDELKPDITIKRCEQGFLVRGETFGGVGLRAFSTVEGLIEWLSRELGAGPIVWALTLALWAELVKVEEEDLVPLPDPSINPEGYQRIALDNARFLLGQFVKAFIPKQVVPAPPEPKPKKKKKAKEEKPKEEVKEE